MDAKLQRRVQRYGWDLAAARYERSWGSSLTDLHAAVIEAAALRTGEHVLDVACGTGAFALEAAQSVGPDGRVVGIDLSGRMIERAQAHLDPVPRSNVEFLRMDAEELVFSDASFDVAVCALGLMYMPDPRRALAEMRRVVKPGGRVVFAVWGERSRCGWAEVFSIVDAEVKSEVCPQFFDVGRLDVMGAACREAGLEIVTYRRLGATLAWSDADEACDAAFQATPVAMAWSRFDEGARARVRERFLDSLSSSKVDAGFRVPGEILLVSATLAP